jgi:hypothetical protein
MKRLYLKERLEHSAEWVQVFVFIMRNRGRNSYGANQLRRLVHRHLLEHTADIEQLKSAELCLNEISNLLQPTKISDLKRLGAKNDGGYIGVDSNEVPFLLSGGAGKNIDFEPEIAEKGSQVHVYDPTIRNLPKLHKNITHFKKALSAKDDQEFKESVTLEEAYLFLNVKSNSPVWLKLDIEGSEIHLLARELHMLPHFQQIFVEFHDTYQVVDPKFGSDMVEILKKLHEHFNLISLVSNNWQGITNFGYAFMPVTFEATFLSKDYPTRVATDSESRSLKSPNNLQRLDIPDLPFQIQR